MKINWGTGIVIAIVLFISYIMYMVVTMVTTHTDIVEEDYYAQQIDYQATKVAKENGLKIMEPVSFMQTDESLNVIFPAEVNVNSIETGQVLFYRPENADLDRKFEINPSLGNVQKIPMKHLTTGNYTVKVRWASGKGQFEIEKKVKVD